MKVSYREMPTEKKNVSASFAGNFYLEMGVVELRARQLATLGVCT